MTPPTVTVTAMSARGLVRPGNEDRVGVFGWLAPAEASGPVTVRQTVEAPLVVAVADGLGGHLAGEVASTRAVEAWQVAPPADDDAVADRFRSIHADLLAAGASRPDWDGMATTLVVAVVCADEVFVAGVGDSRAYHVEPGFVEQLTADDLSPSGSGELTQVLGGRPGQEISPGVMRSELRDGMRLLLCTDGLHSYLEQATLRALVSLPDPTSAVRELRDAVYAEGAPDNVSICLVDITTNGSRSAP
ncbi:PP2C family protein-serine/threonine phosphatase [Actinophytocola sp. KF-1]